MFYFVTSDFVIIFTFNPTMTVTNQHLLDLPLLLNEDNLVLYTHAYRAAHTVPLAWVPVSHMGPQKLPHHPHTLSDLA